LLTGGAHAAGAGGMAPQELVGTSSIIVTIKIKIIMIIIIRSNNHYSYTALEAWLPRSL
jgi:hypothetical protein